MSGLIRKHRLLTGDVLDRRRLRECFFEVAQRLSMIPSHALADEHLTREDFDLHAWVEMLVSHSENIGFITPNYGYVVADSMLEVVHDDSYFEAKLAWSIDVNISDGAASNLLYAFPVIDGVGAYHLMDFLMADQLVSYTFVAGTTAVIPEDGTPQDAYTFDTVYRTNLGNHGNVVGLNGHSHVGIMVGSIGKFKIQKCDIVIKKVLR